MWQDSVLAAFGVFLTLFLVPQVVRSFKNASSNSLITAGAVTMLMFAQGAILLTLDLWMTSCMCCATGLGWLIIFVNRVREIKHEDQP